MTMDGRPESPDDRWRWVLDHAFVHNPIGMALFTLDGRFVKVNPTFCALIGLTEAELLVDTYQALTDPREVAQEQEAMATLNPAASSPASPPTSGSPTRTARSAPVSSPSRSSRTPMGSA